MFLAEDPGAVTPGTPVRLPPRPVSLAGRDDLLADLDVRLTRANGAGPQTVAIHGQGGGGKASVAVEYAYRHLGEVGVAWRFPAEDTTVLAAGFTDLGSQLGIGGMAGCRDPVASVHSALAAYSAGWLLVFDDAPGPEQVREFLPPAGNGRVLITSRNALWPPGETVEVPVLDPHAAAGFLVDRSGDQDEQAARALAGELGGLPLALEQAAAYTRASGDSLAGYLAMFQRRRDDMLALGETSGYPTTVATTWALALTQLEQSAPAATGLLRLLACFAPEAIPLQLLLQPQPGLTHDLAPEVAEALTSLLDDELATVDTVAALREYSLVCPARDRAVSVHRLVQAVTVDQMPAELARAWRQAAAALVEAALPEDPRHPADWPAFAALLPHARAVLDPTSGGMWQVATYLGHSGSHPAARNLFRQIIDAYNEDEAIGPDHPDTLVTRHELAYWTGEAGDAAEARDQCAALLPMIERVLGPSHPATLTTRSNLATWTGETGNAAGARDQFAALLPIRVQELGREHPGTLAARHKLARWTGEAGDAAEARDQYAALLLIEERVSGPEHPDTLAVRHEFARWTGEAGDPAGARDQYATLLPIEEQVSGPEHPDTLAVRHELAHWTGEAGDPAGARDQYATLLPIEEQVPGPKHPDTLAVRHELAHWTGLAGDAAGARDQYATLLPIEERVSGPEHPATLAVRHELAHWTGEAGDPARARDQYATLLPIDERVSGPEHADALTTRHNLAAWAGEAGDAAGARDRYAALLPIEERVSGPEHPATLAARHNLAHWTGLAGDAAGARDHYAALLPILERVSGPEHPATRIIRHELAHWTGEAGDAAGARDQYAALLPIDERTSGSDHPATLTTRGNLTYWTREAADGPAPGAD